MIKPFTPYDWYWIVRNDDNQYWSSLSSSYVSSIPNDAGVTKIDNEYDLSQVLFGYGLKGPAAIPPAQVPMWAVRTVLQNDGLFDQADALVKASADNALKNVWEYGNFADRNSSAIESLAMTLDLTDAQVDQMFIDANKLEV